MSNMTRPVAGNPISATLIRQLIADVRANRIIGGIGLRTRRTSNGTHVDLANAATSTRSPKEAKPWTFMRKEDPDTHEVVAGWYNQTLQFGMTPFYAEGPKGGIKDENDYENADGTYYIKADVSKTDPNRPGALEIVKDPDSIRNDGNTLFFKIGIVEDGEQTYGSYMSPVFYKYLD